VPGGKRSRGWDVDTSYSAPRGELFPKGEGFGHTGFTGTSIGIDPPNDVFIILLSNRVNPTRNNNKITAVRRQLADAVMSTVLGVPSTPH
jgi:CubicO group peptidase (beta-lactamase class C family)